jgi:hypothetical protein
MLKMKRIGQSAAFTPRENSACSLGMEICNNLRGDTDANKRDFRRIVCKKENDASRNRGNI